MFVRPRSWNSLCCLFVFSLSLLLYKLSSLETSPKFKSCLSVFSNCWSNSFERLGWSTSSWLTDTPLIIVALVLLLSAAIKIWTSARCSECVCECVCVCVHLCACVFVCVWERERECQIAYNNIGQASDHLFANNFAIEANLDSVFYFWLES